MPKVLVFVLSGDSKGDMGGVRSALNLGASADTRDELGSTVRMHAAAYGSLECMRALIAAGADVSAASNAGFTPLMWAASPAKLRLLMSRDAAVGARSKDGNSALILARQNRFEDSARVLLAAGAPDEDGMKPAGKPVLSVPRDLLLQMRSLGIEPMHLEASREAVDGGPLFNAVYIAGGGETRSAPSSTPAVPT